MDSLAVGIISNQKLIRKALACLLLTFSTSYNLCIASDVDTVEQIAESLDSAKLDVLLIDVDGTDDPLKCIRRVRELSPSTKTLLLTRQSGEKFSIEVVRNGGWGLVTKQADPEVLRQAIQKVVDGEMWFSHGTMSMALQAFSNHGPSMNSPLDRLAPREAEVLTLLARGCQNKEIASRLFLSESTVRTYIKAVYRKLGVNSRLEAALIYSDCIGRDFPSGSYRAVGSGAEPTDSIS